MSEVTVRLVPKKVGKEMNKAEMAQLIRTVWSDAMSDNGAIWAKSNAKLEQARIDYPELYVQALEWLYSEERA